MRPNKRSLDIMCEPNSSFSEINCISRSFGTSYQLVHFVTQVCSVSSYLRVSLFGIIFSRYTLLAKGYLEPPLHTLILSSKCTLKMYLTGLKDFFEHLCF